MGQEGNRNNPYSFDDYLFVRDRFNYYRDDPFFQALVKKYAGDEYEKVHAELCDLSDRVSYYFRDLANEGGTIENRVRLTKLQHYDAHNRRIDRLHRPAETVELEKQVFGLGLLDPAKHSPFSRFVKLFLLYQNSEAGVMCGFGGTHGMVGLLEKYENTDLAPEAREALTFLREGIERDGERVYGIAGQYMSEIQGGSDVPANLVEAVYEEAEGPDGVSNCWRIYGKKFFCSATQSDYTFLTAKPRGTDSSTKVATFLVPAWLPGNESKEIRNSYTIDRLKSKLGLAELPTAEITYNGAVAYPIGPLEDGLANVVGVVLALSRLHVAFGSAAGFTRIQREASLYSQFRKAFGIPVGAFPLMMNQLSDVERCSKRTTAGAFKLYDEFIQNGEKLAAGTKDLEAIDDVDARRRLFRLRELVLLQKIAVTDEQPAMIRQCISFFGGHGIVEDFSSLPRMFRDSMIQELWEGPRNVLLTQIHRDFSKVAEWYPADQFCRDVLAGADDTIVEPLAKEFARLMTHPTLLMQDEETLAICRDWEEFSNTLIEAYQDQALAELAYKGKPLDFHELLGEFKAREEAGGLPPLGSTRIRR
ncbi:MAG: acyl-CoA dehydrogenase family protein [Polyangiales bacterium]